MERFDGRGRKLKVRLAKVESPMLYKLGFSCAVANFKPETLITQHELKARAESLILGKYKQIKRAIAKREQQRRLNWFMSVVMSLKFVKNLKKAVRESREAQQKKKEQEE